MLKSGGGIPSLQELNAALVRCTGEMLQTPPRFSALKVNGMRAYALARANKEFELSPRRIHVYSLAAGSYDEALGLAECTMICSSRTYVRSLVRDIAAALATVAYAAFIRRMAIGPFSVEAAEPFETLDSGVSDRMVPVKDALAFLPSVKVTEEQYQSLVRGRDIAVDAQSGAEKTVIAYAGDGRLAAILTKKESGMFHPRKVFTGG